MKPGDHIDTQRVEAEPVEYVDLYIPIYRIKDQKYWSGGFVYYTKAEAVASLPVHEILAEAKILHHIEKIVK